ncbi:hypothetical protein RJ639_034734 [Escallonia herrerae]|uniref:Uncharacterized protein n=1 Tax=Escallonia herrerae TaxID=1293975 RepID=A0AA88WXZ1_9ASTE|nr:hypothetical protein RJ639_034734 [Escallonia herrerae]
MIISRKTMRNAVGQLIPTRLWSNVISNRPLQLLHHHDKRLRPRKALKMVHKPCSDDPAFGLSSSQGGEDLILLMEGTGGRESSQGDGVRGGLGEDCGASPPKKGYLAVYVGKERMRRFVIPASYLSLPEFRALMDGVADEFGYQHHHQQQGCGGLRIPICEEDDFQDLLNRCGAKHPHQMMRSKKKKTTINVVRL